MTSTMVMKNDSNGSHAVSVHTRLLILIVIWFESRITDNLNCSGYTSAIPVAFVAAALESLCLLEKGKVPGLNIYNILVPRQ